MNTYINYSYAKNKEEISYITPKGDIKQIQLKFWEDELEDILGSCFCSILNSKESVINSKKLFNKEHSHIKIDERNIMSETAQVMNSAFHLLLNANPYFIILYNDFFEATIGTIPPSGVENTTIAKFTKEIISRINKIYDNIIETINVFDEFYSKDMIIDKIYLPPSVVSAVNGNVTNKMAEYSYKIHNLDELLGVSFYLININKYHIKKCHGCNKYFSTNDGRFVFCNNPSPFNNSKSCKNIKKTIGVDFKQWEIELSSIDKEANTSGSFFRDNIKKIKNQRKKDMIENNYRFFLDISKEYRKYIKGATNEDTRKTYLESYKSFVEEVRKNQLSEPHIYKVKVPKFPKIK